MPYSKIQCARFGFGMLLMFNEQGAKEDLRVTGFMGPKDFAAHLDHLVK